MILTAGLASHGLDPDRAVRGSPRKSTARGSNGVSGAGLVWAGSAAVCGKLGKSHDPPASCFFTISCAGVGFQPMDYNQAMAGRYRLPLQQ